MKVAPRRYREGCSQEVSGRLDLVMTTSVPETPESRHRGFIYSYWTSCLCTEPRSEFVLLGKKLVFANVVMASRAKNSPTHHTTRLSPVVSCLVGCAATNQLVSLGIGAVLLGCLAGSCSELTAQIIRGYYVLSMS
jgi:hypothetical protein